MDPTSLVGVGTWLADKIMGSILGRPRLRLSIRIDYRGPFFAIGNRVAPSPRSVVVRAVNLGRRPIEVETIAIELDDHELVLVKGGDPLPAVIGTPGHLERDESRKALAQEIGARQALWIIAIGTDDRRYRSRMPPGWRIPVNWPD